MATLSSYNKTELVALVEQYRNQIDDLNAANELLAAGVEAAADAPASAPSVDIAADMMMTGFLRTCIPAKRKDGSVVDGLFKFAVETSVSYTDGQDADGNYLWQRVSNYKTVWFTADEALADQLQTLLDANEWTIIRNWYRYATSARNVIDVKQLDYETKEVRTDANGNVLTSKALRHPADLKAMRVDVVTSAAKGAGSDNNDVV